MYLLEITGSEVGIAGIFLIAATIGWLGFELRALKEEIKPKLGINHEATKLQLQAYERLTVFVERAKLNNLVSRLHTQNTNVKELQLAILQEINTEYDYNISQQVYVSPEIWQAITKVKDQNIFIVNQLANSFKADVPSIELSKALLEYASNENAEVNNIVLNAIQYESKKVLHK